MILDVSNVDTYYGETQALFGVSLAVAPGEVVALLGPNGAGKTTTIRSVLGLTRPRRGQIRFDGRDIGEAPTHEIVKAENLPVHPELAGRPRDVPWARVRVGGRGAEELLVGVVGDAGVRAQRDPRGA